MKISRFARAVVAFGAVAACLFVLAACSNSSSTASVAATVDGEEIAEQTVTDQIQQIREQSGLAEEEEMGNVPRPERHDALERARADHRHAG